MQAHARICKENTIKVLALVVKMPSGYIHINLFHILFDHAMWVETTNN